VTPNPGFKVSGYLRVEYLADGTRVFNCTKHSCRSLWLYRQEAQLMLTTGSTRLAVSRGKQTWYHSTCYI